MSINIGIRAGAASIVLRVSFCTGFLCLGCLFFVLLLCLCGLRIRPTRGGVSGGESDIGCTYRVLWVGFEANLALRRLCRGSVGLGPVVFELAVSVGGRTGRDVLIGCSCRE